MKRHYIRLFTISAILMLLLSSTVLGQENTDIFENITQSNNIPGLSDMEVISVNIPDPENVESEETNEEDTQSLDNVVSEIPDSDPIYEDASSGSVISGGSDNDNTVFYNSLSVSVNELELKTISENVISINEVLHEIEKNQKDFNTKFSRTREHESLYQEDILYLLLSIAQRLSANEIKTLSMDTIKLSVSYNDVFGVSENMIEISENSADPSRSVSDDNVVKIKLSDNSVSKNDIDQLHKDNEEIKDLLSQLFYVGIFGVLALFLLVAGQLEQIIFRRMKG